VDSEQLLPSEEGDLQPANPTLACSPNKKKGRMCAPSQPSVPLQDQAE
jgi:hypothetical protein